MNHPLQKSKSLPSQNLLPWLYLVVWMIGLTALSLSSLHLKRVIGTTGPWHNVGHVGAFLITGLLFLQARRSGPWDVWDAWPVLAFAVALEWLESALYGGSFEWKDIATDTLGMALALAICFIRRLSLRSIRG
jgi:hypothetical protein